MNQGLFQPELSLLGKTEGDRSAAARRGIDARAGGRHSWFWCGAVALRAGVSEFWLEVGA